MSDLKLATKQCTKCKETKPASEFYRNRRRPDGLQDQCKPCASASVKAARARRRAEMGEEAWLALQRDIVRRHRERTGLDRDRAYNRAQNQALATLRDRHRTEYEHLLLLARRGEL